MKQSEKIQELKNEISEREAKIKEIDEQLKANAELRAERQANRTGTTANKGFIDENGNKRLERREIEEVSVPENNNVNPLENEKEAIEAEIAGIQERLDQVEQFNAMKGRIKKYVKRYDKEISKLELDKNNIEKEIESIQTDKNKIISDIEKANKEKAKLIEEKNSFADRRKELEDEIKHINDKRQKRKESKLKDIEKLDEELEKFDEANRKLENDNKKLLEEIESLEGKIVDNNSTTKQLNK